MGWAFNAEWLEMYAVEHIDAEIIRDIQEARHEDSNDAIFGLIRHNWDMFVKDTIASDGRGHFLAHYDGEEHEVYVPIFDEYMYVYRQH